MRRTLVVMALGAAACGQNVFDLLPAEGSDASTGGGAGSTATGGGGAAGAEPACVIASDCLLATHPVCTLGSCVECAGAGDCGSEAPFCDVARGACAECLQATDCGGDRICEPATGLCREPCASDPECSSGSEPSCDPVRGHCVECTSDAACTSGSAPRCDPALGRCVECLGDADCDPATAPRCDPGLGRCVECLASSDCPPGTSCLPVELGCS